MKDLQSMARKSLKGDGDTHRTYSTRFWFIIICLMDSYHKRKKVLEERYGKWITLKPFNDERAPASRRGIVDNEQQKYIKQIADISDEEGLKRAYETKDGLCQHYNKLIIAGTEDPINMVDDLKLPLDDTLNITTRGNTADAYYRSHHEKILL